MNLSRLTHVCLYLFFFALSSVFSPVRAWSENPDSPTLININQVLQYRVTNITAGRINNNDILVSWRTIDPRTADIPESHHRLLKQDGNVLWSEGAAGFESNRLRYFPVGNKSVINMALDGTNFLVDFDDTGSTISDGIPMPGSASRGRHAVLDGEGGAIAVWIDQVEAPLPVVSRDVVYIQRVDSLGNAMWGIDPMQLTSPDGTTRSVITPYIVSDDAAGAIVVYTDYIEMTVERINSNGEHFWNSRIQLSGDLEAFVANKQGGVYIVWDDIFTDLATGDIHLQNIDSEGNPLWGSDGIILTSGEFLKHRYKNENVIIQPHPDNGVYATWQEKIDGDIQIITAYVNANGDIVWKRQVADTLNLPRNKIAGTRDDIITQVDQFKPETLVEEDGSIIIAYVVNWDVYLQKLSNSGERLWGDSAFRAFEASSREFVRWDLVLVDDLNNGAIVLFPTVVNSPTGNRSEEKGYYYAQRVYSHGDRSTSQQPQNMAPVNDALDVNMLPTLQGSPFKDVGDATQVGSRWRIYNSGQIVYDSGETSDLTQHTVFTDALLPGTDYQWKVSYKNINGEWTRWSEPTSFTTIAVADGGSSETTSPEVPVEDSDPSANDTNSGGGVFNPLFLVLALLLLICRINCLLYIVRHKEI